MQLHIKYTYCTTVIVEVTEEQFHDEEYVRDIMNTAEPSKDMLKWTSTETVDENGNSTD